MNFGYQSAPAYCGLVISGKTKAGWPPVPRAGRRAGTVQVPVPQPEGDEIGEPHGAAAGQQHVGIIGERGLADGGGGYQAYHRSRIHYGDHADQRARHGPQPGGIAVDAARVADDQRGEQHYQDQGENPAGVSGPELSRQDRAQRPGGQHGQRHRPARLADPKRSGRVSAGQRGRTRHRHRVIRRAGRCSCLPAGQKPGSGEIAVSPGPARCVFSHARSLPGTGCGRRKGRVQLPSRTAGGDSISITSSLRWRAWLGNRRGDGCRQRPGPGEGGEAGSGSRPEPCRSRHAGRRLAAPSGATGA